MVEWINTGGPAFPIECNIVNGLRNDEGISVLDHFAAVALQGMLASEKDEGYTPHGAAFRAYQIAHAMLVSRSFIMENNSEFETQNRDDDQF